MQNQQKQIFHFLFGCIVDTPKKGLIAFLDDRRFKESDLDKCIDSNKSLSSAHFDSPAFHLHCVLTSKLLSNDRNKI